MRVAQISTWQTACGIAGYTQQLRSALLAAGVTCDVVPVDRVALRYMPLPELRAAILDLGRRAADADVVHIQHEFAFFAGAYGWPISVRLFHELLDDLHRRGKPVAVTFHTEPSFDGRHQGLTGIARKATAAVLWKTLIARNFAPGRDIAAIVHTRSSRLSLIRSGLPARTVNIMRQGTPPIQADLSDAEREHIKQDLGYPAGARVMSLFGFISAYKGPDTALRALKHLPSEYHLAIVGGVHPFSEERTLDDVLRRANTARLRDRVHVTGYLPSDELHRHLAATDIFIAPYQPAPKLSSSAALTWALASGKPVVASRIPAFVELNEEYGCLDLVAPGASYELANEVLALDHDDKRRADLTEQGRRYCEENSWKRMADQHIRLYERLSGSPTPLPVASEPTAAAV